MNLENLMKLAGCGDPDMERIAQVALELHESYSNGSLADDEYKELLEDLIRADDIDGLASDVELKGMLLTGVAGLLSVI